MTVAESESDIRITTDTLYLALTGKLWCLLWEIGENEPRFNGTALYYIIILFVSQLTASCLPDDPVAKGIRSVLIHIVYKLGPSRLAIVQEQVSLRCSINIGWKQHRCIQFIPCDMISVLWSVCGYVSSF